MELGVYLSPDELTIESLKYIFDKSYEFDTADLAYEAHSRIYVHSLRQT